MIAAKLIIQGYPSPKDGMKSKLEPQATEQYFWI